ncbi:MAG: hypothetical protein IT494_08870 [Gammaproteobacteria bacterium]|nr:hypothetical protein [Gammaproteobacteria bacterium]
MVVTGPGFADLGRLTGMTQGIPALQVAVYPGPFDLHTDDELKHNATREVVPQIVRALTDPLPEAAAEKMKPARDAIAFTGTLEQINRHFAERGWSDGMAIVPPTVERIQEFLRYTSYPPDEEIAVLASANLRATPWNIAVNAIMAGARPEHLPVIIAMVQAIGLPPSTGSDLDYAAYSGSTHGFQSFFWVNGPIARQLGIDYGQGLIEHPINQVIGRTMSLIGRNIAGFRVKETKMTTFGKPTSWVLAEDEEAIRRIGWAPYHVDKGYALNANVVTTGTSTVWGQNLIPSTSDPQLVMQVLAYGITHSEQFASGTIRSRRYVLVAPTTAKVLADGGYTKESLKAALIDTSRKVTHEWAFSKVYGSPGFMYPPFEEELANTLAEPAVAKGKLPPWLPRFPGWEKIETTPAIAPGKLEIIVCGDPSRNKAQTLAGGGLNSVEIRLPPNWDALMQAAGYPPLRDFMLND